MIEGTWSHDATSNRVILELTQTQPGDAYRVGLDIGINGGDRVTRMERVEMTAKSQRFEITVKSTVAGVELDPGTWLLAGLSLEAR